MYIQYKASPFPESPSSSFFYSLQRLPIAYSFIRFRISFYLPILLLPFSAGGLASQMAKTHKSRALNFFFIFLIFFLPLYFTLNRIWLYFKWFFFIVAEVDFDFDFISPFLVRSRYGLLIYFNFLPQLVLSSSCYCVCLPTISCV